MANTWKLESFKPAQIKQNMDTGVFKVPRYQRGIVWSETQKADLIDTIKKGLPFGSLLLYKEPSGKYQIIDGLQRVTTVFGFVENPAQFFNDDDIDNTVIPEIVRKINVAGSQTIIAEKVNSSLIDWVKHCHTLDAVIGMQFYEFGEIIAKEFPTCLGKEGEIGRLIQPMLKAFQQTCYTINDINIPAIVIEGDPDLLPVLFERINSKGTQLSKYQIYAASWNTDEYCISDNLVKIVIANRDRYDSMLGGMTNIDDYDSVAFLNEKVLNTYEIAFGFGKMLCDSYPHLFGTAKEQTQVDSVGFTLINICLGLKNKDAHKMSSKLKELIGNSNINIFLTKIIECVKFVDGRIGKYNTFKSNSRPDSGKNPLHTEFQICSLIASVFLMKYADITLDSKENIVEYKIHLDYINNDKWSKSTEAAFKKNAPKIYIMEILQRRWSGTGDKKMDQVLITPNYYTRDVTRFEFSNNLDNWFANLNNERSEIGKVAAAKEPELLMLALVYLMNNFSALNHLDDSKFDIEHLATKQLMKEKLISKYNGDLRLPISSFGNLCLLPEYDNRSKGKKTIYQDAEYLKKTKKTISYIEDNYSFTKKEDLDWLSDKQLSADEFKEAYFNFIQNRFDYMKNIILDHFDRI
ncbi:MAG: DUF262 domain-containing protein [Clostridia bacterium]|nr:DUF262 domain-containing protein [Clostridia bacterium]